MMRFVDDQLLAMVPQPVKAIVLLFPITKEYEAKRKEEDERIAKEGQHPIDPTLIWIKQTVCFASFLCRVFVQVLRRLL
jgi:ubiquitin carboxyl-terminal hydrolase L3